MIIVPDASIAIKWYVDENHTDNAEKLLDGTFQLHAPELIRPEFGNIVWKKVRRNDLNTKEGATIIDAFNRQKISYHTHETILKAAYIGAEITGQTVYDWTYLALAVSLSCQFLTADERFYKALRTTSMKKYLIWLGDF
jgi:predicted nucleic acid-binding protein